jgi:hypothetical protein
MIVDGATALPIVPAVRVHADLWMVAEQVSIPGQQRILSLNQYLPRVLCEYLRPESKNARVALQRAD